MRRLVSTGCFGRRALDDAILPEVHMSSLSGKDGPRIRHAADTPQPYEMIGVDKLTPAKALGPNVPSALRPQTT